MSSHTPAQLFASWCFGIGILLILLGIQGIRYIPMTPEERKKEEDLQNWISQARQARRQLPPEAREVADMAIAQLEVLSIRNKRECPYRTHGICAVSLGGLSLLIGFGIWIRCSSGFRWIKVNEDA
jgi:hypothetical protein